MAGSNLHQQSVAELGRLLRTGKLSPVELTRHYLARIESLDPKLNAFRLVSAERALDAARRAESELRSDRDLGLLHGIPYVAKDLFDVQGLPTSAGARVLEDNIADRDSTVVARMDAAGMILLGKTNTVQFAYGGAGVNHDHGTPHNPWLAEHYLPGGSSSGTGVAVAARMAPAGLGTDTGGSVRIPASLCGITGLKTTVGRVSRAGVYPLSWSLDSVGLLATTVEDTGLIYRTIRGVDPEDDSTIDHPHGDEGGVGPAGDLSGLRIAFAESGFWEGVDPEVAELVRGSETVFAGLGAQVESIEFPEAQAARELNPRAGIIAAEAYTLNRRLLEEKLDQLDPIVASRMLPAREMPAHEYLRTALERKVLCRRAARVFDDVDALLCPTTMIAARSFAEVEANTDVYHSVNVSYLRNTAIGNILGLCGLSVPCGFTSKGLPVGLMIYGRPFDEERVLRIGQAFQQATEWHQRIPDLGWANDR
jgi:aspartyl-tRNA(Asn)/glutamyl-tRNA(Gln) amidotransferase subunit A